MLQRFFNKKEKCLLQKKKKQQIVSDLKDRLSSIKIVILINYSGLTTKESDVLREKLETQNSQLQIVKNNLVKIAIKEANIDVDPEIFKGQIALVFSNEDEIFPAKTLAQFYQKTEKPNIIGAIYENEFITKEKVEQLAKIPDRQILLAQLVANTSSPLTGLVHVLKANLTNLVLVLNQYKNKLK